ncbi:class I SAM-dependent DNA methyltransferase [Vibrio marisflavi]|uniref:Ubiquinone biosynthesis O-methyltransferase, mitochondrial n=1 Tax=Vibrio marisflavi CECT 7928 TaxID=634439 RepID=A0ABM9A716_9VIBR|nr:class I SAM-dependent methyltransferase [Vibrio marisflavi]CAH0540988.1 Ubiquinone biosynthesis O-methyltransferase, mitochondrial [Vibrio marisflavi CECT 7928]
MESLLYSIYAKDYGRVVLDNVYNAQLERPSHQAMFPDLQGKHVLDLGCGPGVYAQYMTERGAKVTSIDVSQDMVDIVRGKLGEKVKAYRQDLNLGLPEEQTDQYDLVVSPLAVHYLEDLTTLFNDIKRVLKKGGLFLFSTHHPMIDFQFSPSGNYFQQEMLTQEWDIIGKPVEVRFYRRSFTQIFQYITQAGFAVVEFNEGCPAESMKDSSPESYKLLSSTPNFTFYKCRVLE